MPNIDDMQMKKHWLVDWKKECKTFDWNARTKPAASRYGNEDAKRKTNAETKPAFFLLLVSLAFSCDYVNSIIGKNL